MSLGTDLLHLLNCRVGLLLALALLMTAAPVHALEVTDLRCEMKVNPLGIDTSAPRLSWVLKSEKRGEAQAAYQVLVATSSDLLEPGKADLWDSGRTQSDESVHVVYAGKPIGPNQRVFWAVRAWGRTGDQSAFSAGAWWTTGLQPSGWKAQWIGASKLQVDANPLERAHWIWAGEPVNDKGDYPPAAHIFRRSFELPRATVTSATLLVSVDNDARVLVNGDAVGEVKEWRTATEFDVTNQIKSGKNVLQIDARNGADKPNPAGLLASLSLRYADGTSTDILTNVDWETASGDAPKNWQPAHVVGEWGMQPWGKVRKGTAEQLLPIFRKAFSIQKPVRRAIVHVTGLGHYKLFVNGKPASDTFLDPPWTKYERTIFYNTLDVTSLLNTGRNAFGMMLGKGFYSTSGDRRIHGIDIERPLVMILQAEVEYEDGTRETVISDGSWKWIPGPMTHNSILGGTSYDARRLPAGWSEPTFDDSQWQNAAIGKPESGVLTAAISPPLRKHDQFTPKSVDQPEPGIHVYDFGQNASAAPWLKVKGPAGTTLRLTYAEQRHGATLRHNDGKGRVDQTGMGPGGYFEYTLRGGGEEEWFSDFFYSGFQYLELTGAVPAGQPNPENKPVVTQIKSIHVRSSAEPVGTFSCSNEMYNKIDGFTDWAVRSNLGHVLTDCPHREKLGWLEVVWLMWGSMAPRYDLTSFGPKVARDIRDSQLPDGTIYTVAPSYPTWSDGFQYTPEWGAAGVFIPWYTYQWYGDRRVLEDNFEMMKSFVDYMKNTSNNLIPKAGLGDWYDYGHGQPLGPSRFTPVDLTATAVFHECADLVSSAALVLGRKDDAVAYRKLAEDIRDAFNKKYYKGDGEYQNTGSPQTANGMALVFGLVEDKETSAVINKIVEDVRERGNMQTSGDVGYRFLLRALADAGRSDVIYDILNRTELGSYPFLVNAGWTTLPESWNAERGNSMNHCMLGHIQEWFVSDLVGIRQDNSTVGWKQFHIKPTPGGDVTSATAKTRTPYGEISTSWKRDGTAFSVAVAVPVSTTAYVHLPAKDASAVIESGKPVTEADGVKYVGQESGNAVFAIGAGKYQFRVGEP